ncbi:hypothetical protein RHMOL_Rhmol10G0278400 [Rhododendron molle]|uniref:Uncharacterized protein n=1 Tax=Rhododendron molle TaxID=49168 RepID=A0ACC0M7B0_RHOML|nr:hypothetical protein RHMOL_Rhmol10G0278400 [Rhododendron molle]
MGLAATSVLFIPLLLSLFAGVPPVTAKLKTTNINDTYNLGKAFQVDSPAIIDNDALQVTINSFVSADDARQVTINSVRYQVLFSQAGRILYKSPFTLWEGQNDTDRVASFNSSFLVTLYRLGNITAGEGLTFVVAPDLNLPPNSNGEYLGLTNSYNDGDDTNCLIAVELDTFEEDFDPDSNHIGLNINSVRSSITTSLTPLGFQLVGEGVNFFNVWIQYDGIKKVLNQNSYFGFSASTGVDNTQFNTVLWWNLTVEYYHNVNWVKIGLIVGIPTAVLLPTLVVLVYYFRKRWLLQRSDQKMSGKVKSMPGMPREY